MNYSLNIAKTLEIIQKMNIAKIGEAKKWNKILRKIKKQQEIFPSEMEYISNLTRIYKDSHIVNRSKIYHTKLSEHDLKPPCKKCSKNSEFYCNMNDQYFCISHVVGHDENEF